MSDSKYTHGRAAHNVESLSTLLNCLSRLTCSANISYFVCLPAYLYSAAMMTGGLTSHTQLALP